MVLVVTAAHVPEREGAEFILQSLTGSCKKIRRIWVDGGYNGKAFPQGTSGFKLLPAAGLVHLSSRFT